MKEMTVDDIIKENLEKNYKGTGLTLERYFAHIRKKVANGSKIFRYKNILIIYDDMGDGGVEWHAINGGMPVEELVKAADAFGLTMRDRGYKYAFTFYDNPKSKEIFNKSSVFPTETYESSDPRGKYQSVTRLA